MPHKNIEDRRTYNNQWYANSSEEARDRKARNRAERRKQITEKVWAWKETHPCVDCGEADPIVLDFDHVVFPKSFDISKAINQGVSWEKIEEEIAKCEMRCANCHRRVTYARYRNMV